MLVDRKSTSIFTKQRIQLGRRQIESRATRALALSLFLFHTQFKSLPQSDVRKRKLIRVNQETRMYNDKHERPPRETLSTIPPIEQ